MAMDLIREYPLGLIVHSGSSEYVGIDPLPFVVHQNQEKQYLWGHLAKANPLLKTLGTSLEVCFLGPNRYISASLCPSPGSVPTWGYCIVQIFGSVEIITERKDLIEILTKSVTHFEGATQGNWLYDADDEKIRNLEVGIVGLKIEIHKVEAKYKMLLNKKSTDYLKILNHFGESDERHDQVFHHWMLKTRG